MTASTTTFNFNINTAEQFHESFNETDPTRMYMFVGRVTSFANDAAPTTVANTPYNSTYDVFRDMVTLKRINYTDTTHVCQRYNWTNNTIYTQYTDTNPNLFSSQFYVITSDYNVYKCIDNNRGSPSTEEPAGVGTSLINTSDGYRWKFMFNVSSSDALKFLNNTYIPVVQITANNGSAQWAVQQAAANGSIDHMVISANGNGYLSLTNTFSAITNSTVVRLNSEASSVDGIYNNSTVFISSGLGSGQLRRITRYIGITKSAVVNGSFTITPNTQSTYYIGPNVIIMGDSGATLSQRATAYVSNCVGGQVRKITMISTGRNYSTANVTIRANTSYGSGAIVSPALSPQGGHGSSAVNELNAKSIMISVSLGDGDANTYPANNDLRMVGLIRNPKLRSGAAANVAIIDQTSRIVLTGVTGDFREDEVVVGSTSGSKARVVQFANTNSIRTQGILKVVRVTTGGTGLAFSQGETLTADTTGTVGTVSSFAKPAVREGTGQVLYIENKTPITRTSDQIEDFRFVVTF
jgi:hypothetical protein